MGSSSPAGNTTTTTNSAPWDVQQPYLGYGLNQAGSLYANGPDKYPANSTVAGFTGQQTNAINQLTNQASTQAPVISNAMSADAGIAGGSGLNNPATMMASSYYSSPGSAESMLGSPGAYQSALGNAGTGEQALHTASAGESALNPASGGAYIGTNPGDSYLSRTANGSMLNANPYVNSMFASAAKPVVDNFQTSIAPTTDSLFAGAGRYGSGADVNAQTQNENTLGTTLGNLSSQIYGQNYANERQLQQGAQTQIANDRNTETGQQISAAGTQGSLANQRNTSAASDEIQRAVEQAQLESQRQGAAASLETQRRGQAVGDFGSSYGTAAGQQIQGINAAPTLDQAQYTDPNMLYQAGQLQQGQNQSQLTDQTNRYFYNQQAPWANLSRYGAAIQGNYGGTSQQQTPYFTNPASSMLGLGIGGLSLANSLGAFK